MIEQRRSKRFELRLPIEVTRKSFQPVSVSGQTRNLSAGGVLFATKLDVEVGEAIEYIIHFPTESPEGTNVNLHCLGKVVRFEKTVSEDGELVSLVAATLERYEFQR